jgi:hypothetical protein
MCNNDVSSINNDKFQSYVDSIYPSELDIKDITELSTSASYMDVLFNIDAGGKLTNTLYDKQDDLNFAIIFPYTVKLVKISQHWDR